MGDFSKIDRVRYQRYDLCTRKRNHTHRVSRKYIRLPDGGTLGIDFTPPLDENLDPSTPVIVVEHGLTGGNQ
jgi:uncharacterized protein